MGGSKKNEIFDVHAHSGTMWHFDDHEVHTDTPPHTARLTHETQ